MKHLHLFESWHVATPCPHCKGTGFMGQGKKESAANVLKNSTEEHLMELMDDSDFVEHVVEFLKDHGVYNMRVANMVAALDISREDLAKIIAATEEGISAMEEIVDHDSLRGRLDDKELKKIRETIGNKAQILAKLRK